MNGKGTRICDRTSPHCWTKSRRSPRWRPRTSTTLPGPPAGGAKAAGVVVDDAAVTPRYVEGVGPKSRELPIIKKITIGSLSNKLLVVLPIAWRRLERVRAVRVTAPLLVLGGRPACSRVRRPSASTCSPRATRRRSLQRKGAGCGEEDHRGRIRTTWSAQSW
ncbi:DUF808 family protein [Kocuria rhizophila]|nr:DUF808 family protein [Kocuria rhizophila]